MTRRVSSTPRAALAAAAAVFVAAGVVACTDDATEGPVPPIVMTDADGVLHGPGEGAEPVRPAEPAPAGHDTPQETRRDEASPAPRPVEDDDPEPPPPPPPPPPADDADDGDDAEVDDTDDAVDSLDVESDDGDDDD